MISSESIRKAALVTSLMDRKQRARLLTSLPADVAMKLTQALHEIEQQGWDRRDIVEQVLGEELSTVVVQQDLGLDALIALSGQLDSVHFARILTATQPGSPEFVLSMLEDDFAEHVRACIESLPVMPDRLRTAVCAHARTWLDGDRMKVPA